MLAQYNQWIVALSYVVAVIASYVALDMATRVTASKGTSTARYWLIGGSVAMGTGIWSMHFVGMLAFSLPIPVPYSIPITFLSLAFAIGASGIALHTISRGTLSKKRLLTAGLVMGGGVGLMHYTGMAALQIVPRQTYDPTLFVVSIAIAVAASIAAMWICFQLKSDTMATAFWKKSGSALVMGVAIWGMHFTGMAAAKFSANSYCLGNPQAIDNKWLAITIGLCTFLFLATTMLISWLDAKMTERRSTLEAQSERFFNQSLNLICICGFDGRFHRINPACWQTLGQTREALLALPFINIVHAEDRPVVAAAVQKLASGAAVTSIECRCHCADGSYKSLLWNATPSEDGLGFYATGHDITGRKRAEAELASTHLKLIASSRAAGMAEVASNVLHNVGNVLNSVNISASLVIDGIAKCRTPALARVVALLREHEGDLGSFITSDPRGKQVPVYLGQLSEHLQAEQQMAVKELESLRRNIDHIKEIVAMQQGYAKVSGTTEVVDVKELLEDALRMSEAALARHGVAVVREFENIPTVSVEKHKVLQILVNLVRNAKFACVESGHADKRITLHVANSDDRIRISVADNGVGISPENLARVFSHGFTTRKDGHGFGLHSGALAAKEMGGSLKVHSDGTGKGATFTLELPPPREPAPSAAVAVALEIA